MQDQFGNELSCTSAAAAAAYDRAVDAHLHAWPGVAEALDEALAHDPAFPLAHGLRALVLAAQGQRAQARTALEQARAAPVLTSREHAHLDLVAAVVAGRAHEALPLLIAHVRQAPCDVVAIATGLGAYGLFAFSGREDHDRQRFEFLEALAPHHPADFPWLLAHRGWARIELGRVDEGLAMAQRALALRPANAHNAHFVMHGLHEARRPAELLEFLGTWLPGYPSQALMWGHLQWHGALAEIELERMDAALARLLGPILAYLPAGLPFMGLADVASLLWRLGLRGAGELPWQVAAQHARRFYPDGANVFGELHLAMLAAAERDVEALAAIERRLQATAQAGHEGAPVAIDWVRGLRWLAAGDAQQACRHLDACCEHVTRVGGSNAQRGVVRETREALRLPARA